MIYGKDAGKMTRSLLDAYDLEGRIRTEEKFILKPNLVVPSKPECGAVTHTEIVTALIEYLQDCGKHDITVAEGSWVGASTEEAFRVNGYPEIAKRYGIRLLDTKKDRFRKTEYGGIEMEISESVLDCDFLIDLPVLKGHCQTGMTCALKNLKGCLSDRSKREFHRMGLSRPIAALSMLVHPQLTIVDSISGDLDFEEGGNPVETDRMMLSEDPLAADMLGASLLGFSPDDIEYLALTASFRGVQTDVQDLEIRNLNKPEKGNIMPEGTVRHLASFTEPRDACSACFASLIHALKRLEEEEGTERLAGRRIAVGQGWKGCSMEYGSGSCCSGAIHGVRGCPPSASDILAMLRSLCQDES